MTRPTINYKFHRGKESARAEFTRLIVTRCVNESQLNGTFNGQLVSRVIERVAMEDVSMFEQNKRVPVECQQFAIDEFRRLLDFTRDINLYG